MATSEKRVLQTATTIAKTTPTAVGKEIDVSEHDYITLYLDYVKGDETGLNVYAYFRNEESGTEYQDNTHKDANGTITHTMNELKYTASVNIKVHLLVDKENYVVIKQGGSDNDGTPTGTLAVAYTLTR